MLPNLLSNAVKFTEKGQVLVTVSAELGPEGKTELQFAVRDTGVGLTPEQCERMFQAFSQADSSTSRKFGGTGLGLAISRKLAELMGGRAWVESEFGKGSTFWFSIAAEVPKEATRAQQREGGLAPLAGIHVWIVDSNDTNRRILGRHCESWGMVVRSTANPREALKWMSAGDTCDLCVLEPQMSVAEGAELAAEVQRRHESIKLLILSPIGAALDATAAQRIGLRAPTAKPVRHSTLFDAISKLFHGNAAHSTSATPWASLPADLAQRLPLRILVAEDNAINVMLITHIMQRLGYRVDVAGNGLEVIAALRRQCYDVVLMDVRMPEMDGIAAARWIFQEWSAGQRPRIIALTAGVMPEERQACSDAGFEEFPNKPVEPAALVQALERCRRIATESFTPAATVPSAAGGLR